MKRGSFPFREKKPSYLFEGHISATFCCTDPRVTMFNFRHRARKFSCDMPDHLRDDFDAIELVTVVDGDGEVDHFGENDHVTAVGFDNNFFPLPGLLSGSSEIRQELLLSWRKSSFESSSSARREQFDERVHVQFD